MSIPIQDKKEETIKAEASVTFASKIIVYSTNRGMEFEVL